MAFKTYVPLPSRAAVVYGAMFIDTGTRTGVSILYVSVPRCSKRCHEIIVSQTSLDIGRKEDETLNWMESTGGSRLIESRLLAS